MSKQLSQLEEEANVIKNEEDAGANTAERVGQLFVDIVDWLRDYSEESSGGGGGGGGSEFEAFNPIRSINNINHNPSTNNQVLVWGTNSWEYRDYLTGGGGGTDLSAVWTSLRGYDTDINHKINYSHLTTLTWWGNAFSTSPDDPNGNGEITGRIIAPNGIQIGSAVITWDNDASALKISSSVYSESAVSALGYSSSGGGGGGGGTPLNVPISSINSAQLGDPPTPSSGQIYGIVWNGTNWAYGLVGGGSGGGITLQEVWNSFRNNNDTYANAKIHCKHIPTDDSTIVTDTNNNTIGLSTISIVPPAPGDENATYTKVFVDNYGRVIKATTLSDTDIPSLSASKITSGTFDAARIPSSFATQSWVTSTALSGYATQSWVQLQGYLTSFTETDPTVPSWAKQSTKPSYAFGEITGNVAASQLPTMYWADIAISSQSNNNTSPQFGNLRLRPGSVNYGSYLRFGNSDYCYLYEDTDNHLKIYSSNGIELLTGNNYNIKLNDLLHVYKGGIAGSSSNFPDSTPFTSYTFYNILRSTTHTIDLFVKSTLNIANNSAIRWQDSSGSLITALRLNNNNQFEIGYGMAGSDYLTQIFGGATTGIKFYCGQSNEVASIYKDSSRQGLRIGNALLSWDSYNNALMVQKYDDGTAVNFYSLGGVSGLGAWTGPNGDLTVTNLATEKIVSSTENSIAMGNIKGDKYDNASRWSIQTNGYAKFQRLYLDSTRYLHINSPYSGVYVLMYYNGTTDKEIKLS